VIHQDEFHVMPPNMKAERGVRWEEAVGWRDAEMVSAIRIVLIAPQLLKLKLSHSRHLYLRDQAGRALEPAVVQEIIGALECLGDEAH
jgi:hypothetical protein